VLVDSFSVHVILKVLINNLTHMKDYEIIIPEQSIVVSAGDELTARANVQDVR